MPQQANTSGPIDFHLPSIEGRAEELVEAREGVEVGDRGFQFTGAGLGEGCLQLDDVEVVGDGGRGRGWGWGCRRWVRR